MVENSRGEGAAVNAALQIVIADDHPLFRQALVAAIKHLRPAVDILECDSLGSLQEILTSTFPDLVLLDLKLPDSEGFHGLLALRARFPDVPVAIVSATDAEDVVEKAFIFGAQGFVPKSTGVAALSDALTNLLAGQSWRPIYCIETKLSARRADDCLSPAQMRILSGLQRGLMNKQIAYELGVTEATVKSHLTLLFRKLGVQSRTQALLQTGYSLDA